MRKYVLTTAFLLFAICSFGFSKNGNWYRVGDSIFATEDQYGERLKSPYIFLAEGFFISGPVFISSIMPDGETGYYILELTQISYVSAWSCSYTTKYRVRKGSVITFKIITNNDESEDKEFGVEGFGENEIQLTEHIGYK